MPLYEYECKKCGHRFEKLRKFSDKPIKKCPECGGAVEQLISVSAVRFKGSGWYVTDYAKKSSTPHTSSSNGDSGAKESKEATATKETKKAEAPKTESAAKKQK